ncbi:MAG: hypothetical protein LH628_16495 [Microcoleus sp. CAN_BIN18]|nr:hypothetical protein [Microcoleus sp. CAN_BIN18]
MALTRSPDCKFYAPKSRSRHNTVLSLRSHSQQSIADSYTLLNYSNPKTPSVTPVISR